MATVVITFFLFMLFDVFIKWTPTTDMGKGNKKCQCALNISFCLPQQAKMGSQDINCSVTQNFAPPVNFVVVFCIDTPCILTIMLIKTGRCLQGTSGSPSKQFVEHELPKVRSRTGGADEAHQRRQTELRYGPQFGEFFSASPPRMPRSTRYLRPCVKTAFI